jgi:hypothetical protein
LESLVQNLPEVSIPSHNGPYLSSAKEQVLRRIIFYSTKCLFKDFVFEELLRKNNRKMNSFIEDEYENQQPRKNSSIFGKMRDTDNGESSLNLDDKTPEVESRPFEDPKQECSYELYLSANDSNEVFFSPNQTNDPLSLVNNGSSMLDKDPPSAPSTEEPTVGGFDIPGGIILDGEMLYVFCLVSFNIIIKYQTNRLDSGAIVLLAMEVFRNDGERFQHMFEVYMGHTAGHPLLRFLLFTNQFVYVLSPSMENGEELTPVAEALAVDETNHSPGSAGKHSLRRESDEEVLARKKYNTITSFPLDALECLSVYIFSIQFLFLLKCRYKYLAWS